MDNDKNKALVIIDTELEERDSQKTLWDNIQYFFEKGYDVIIKLIRNTDDASELVDEYGREVDLIVCDEDPRRLNEVMFGTVKNGLNLPIWKVPVIS